MEFRVGDRVRYEGRVGTVVSERRDSSPDMSWVVVEFDHAADEAPSWAWVDWEKWPLIRKVDKGKGR